MIAGGHFFVDRSNHNKSIKSLNKAKESMEKNPRSIIIYPEGTRSIDGLIKPFKKGGLIMAMNMGVPVVPIAMCGTREVMQKKGLRLSKYPLELRIGRPIETSEIEYEKRILCENPWSSCDPRSQKYNCASPQTQLESQ